MGTHLSFQEFDKELTELPGNYAPPDGFLLLAFAEKIPVGSVALQKLSEQVCEMKRLYVRPPFRREGVGRKLALKLIDHAHLASYTHMMLKTLPPMKEATSLYRSLGFRETDPHRFNPVEGAIFMELTL